MTFRKSLLALSVVIMAGGLLAACDDSNQGSVKPAETKQSTSTDASADSQPAEKTVWVWPGQPDDPSSMIPEANLLTDNYMIVYDGSGSMGDPACGSNNSRHTEGIKALRTFASAVPADANLGLFVFDTKGINVRVKLGASRAKFDEAVDAIVIGSGTPLKSATHGGYEELTEQGQRQFGYGRYSLVIITDGSPSAGEDPTRIVNEIVDLTPVEVWAVGFCLDEGHSLNQPGRTFYVPANSPEALLEGLKGVLAEASEDDVTDFVQ